MLEVIGKRKHVSIYLLVLGILITLSIVVGINFTTIAYSRYDLTRSSQEIKAKEDSMTGITSMSSKLSLALLRINDRYESSPENLKKETRLALIENIKSKKKYETFKDPWYVEIMDSLTGVKRDQTGAIKFTQLNEAYILLKLRDYVGASDRYSGFIQPEYKDNILIPSFIYRGYSLFMLGNTIGSLNDLFKARDFNNFYYNPAINLLIEKIKQLLKIRDSNNSGGNKLDYGILAFKTMDFDTSKKVLTELIKDKEFKEKETALYYLARIEEERGNFKDAVKAYDYLKKQNTEFSTSSSVRNYLISKYYIEEPKRSAEELKYLISIDRKDIVDVLLSNNKISQISEADKLTQERLDIANKISDVDLVQSLAITEKDKKELLAILSIVPDDIPAVSSITVPSKPVVNTPRNYMIYPDINPIKKDVVATKIASIDLKIESKKIELESEKTWKTVRDVTEIGGYSTTVVGGGVLAYNTYQLWQVNSLVAQGINPSTVQGINVNTGELTTSMIISGIVGILTGGGFSLFKGITNPDKKIDDIDSAIKLLEEEKKSLSHPLP